MLAMVGISFQTLAWSCFAWFMSLSRRASPTGGLSWFLVALSALQGSSPGGVVCLAVACVLELALRTSLAERAVCLASLILLAAGGNLAGMTLPLLGCAVATAFNSRPARGLLCTAGMIAGLLLQGPPSPAESDRWMEVRLPIRWPRYEWHDTLAVTRSTPRLLVYHTLEEGTLFPLSVMASLGPGCGHEGCIMQGDSLYRIEDGVDTLILRGHEPFFVSLPGEWRPFSPDRIAIRVLGKT